MGFKNENKTGYPSIDKPWLKYYTEDDLKIEVPECTIYQNIYENNKDYPKDIALNYYGNKIRYSVLFDMVEKCAKTLRTIGIKPGDCVTMCTAGVPEAIYTVLACSRIGAIANFINPMFTTEQMIERINDTKAEWILILDAMYPYIEKSLPDTCIRNVVIIPATNSIPLVLAKMLYIKSGARQILKERVRADQKYYSWKEFVQIGADYSGQIDELYEKDIATVMVYSSGTTGSSKGILLTNDGLNSTISYYQRPSFSYKRGCTFLQMIPIWFSTGIVLSMLMPLVLGITVIPEPKFSKEVFANDLAKYKPTMTLTATSLWLYAARQDFFPQDSFSGMEYPITGGEKLLAQDEKLINNFLRNHGCVRSVYKGYGMCELGSTITSSSNDEGYIGKPAGVGYPILNVIVSAFNIDTDEELKYGEHGEIRVCSPARMKGYYKNPEATAKFFKTDSEGRVWGCTGDIGYVDEDGEVFILGRATDCFKRENGDTVYLFDIEEEIFEEPLVNQCKVVDIKEDGKIKLVAHIVFKDGTTDPERIVKRIDEYLKTKLPEYMRPNYYKIRTSMPVHSNGKRDVEALRSDRENLICIE
ncbi:MAG: acyl--CoA ligase [Lachnospiraceae bacterium]|nr:acyl--CoA ligase [Lachnospiraceae bacterium]